MFGRKVVIGCAGQEISDEVRVTTPQRPDSNLNRKRPHYLPEHEANLVNPALYGRESAPELGRVRRKGMRSRRTWTNGRSCSLGRRLQGPPSW